MDCDTVRRQVESIRKRFEENCRLFGTKHAILYFASEKGAMLGCATFDPLKDAETAAAYEHFEAELRTQGHL